MGEKGGKKDKNKADKQKAQQQEKKKEVQKSKTPAKKPAQLLPKDQLVMEVQCRINGIALFPIKTVSGRLISR